MARYSFALTVALLFAFLQPAAQAQQGKIAHVKDKHVVDIELQKDVPKETAFDIKLWILGDGDSASGKLTFAPLEPATDQQVTVDDRKPKIKNGKKANIVLTIGEGARGKQIMVEIIEVTDSGNPAHGYAVVAVGSFDALKSAPKKAPKKGGKDAQTKAVDDDKLAPVSTPIGIGGR